MGRTINNNRSIRKTEDRIVEVHGILSRNLMMMVDGGGDDDQHCGSLKGI